MGNLQRCVDVSFPLVGFDIGPANQSLSSEILAVRLDLSNENCALHNFRAGEVNFILIVSGEWLRDCYSNTLEAVFDSRFDGCGTSV